MTIVIERTRIALRILMFQLIMLIVDSNLLS